MKVNVALVSGCKVIVCVPISGSAMSVWYTLTLKVSVYAPLFLTVTLTVVLDASKRMRNLFFKSMV